MALTLYGVTVTDAHASRPLVPDTELVAARDLSAIVGPTEYAFVEATPDRVEHHTEVVAEYARRGAVLPAPVGVVFRSSDAVQRWMELHYVVLWDALSFVENRIVGRVHVWRPGDVEEREVGADLAAAAADSLRILRRAAVSTVPLRTEKYTGIVLSAAFLIEQELWQDFASEVTDQGRQTPNLRFELTGPWPPYDFVHMQLGA